MNKIKYLGPSHIADNDLDILINIFTIIEYTDPDAEIRFNVNQQELICYITPSNQEFREGTIQNLLWINKHLKIKIHYSKSLSISKGIWFNVKLM